VEGLLGCAAGRGHVVGSVEEVKSLAQLEGPVCVVAQTTQDEEAFEKIAERLGQRYPQARFHRTICLSTRMRQEEVRQLASEADAVVVVGGRNSANTARLAQIASAAGVPTYHIETPGELDGCDFSQFSRVAVTAGASTPNWIIRKVVTHLAHANRSRLDRFFEPARAFVRFLALSNLYVAAGAGALTYCASVLLGVPFHWRYPVIAFLSILSLHTVNQYLAAREVSHFYVYGRSSLVAGLRMVSAAVSAVAAVVLAATVGWLEALVVALGLGVGSIYGMQVAPDALRRITGFRSLRDIPASKDIFAAAGWAVLVAGLPAMSDWRAVGLVRLALVFALVFVMVYVRSTLLDVGEIERDRAVGREATPFVLGKRRTKILLACLVLGSLALLLTGYFSSIFGSLALLMCALPFYTAGYLFLYHQRLVTREISLELLVDGKFILTGALTCLWAAGA
jgi:4-hydroxy-3-methylbut-2-enyl diphosphate reductase